MWEILMLTVAVIAYGTIAGMFLWLVIDEVIRTVRGNRETRNK